MRKNAKINDHSNADFTVTNIKKNHHQKNDDKFETFWCIWTHSELVSFWEVTLSHRNDKLFLYTYWVSKYIKINRPPDQIPGSQTRNQTYNLRNANISQFGSVEVKPKWALKSAQKKEKKNDERPDVSASYSDPLNTKKQTQTENLFLSFSCTDTQWAGASGGWREKVQSFQ